LFYKGLLNSYNDDDDVSYKVPWNSLSILSGSDYPLNEIERNSKSFFKKKVNFSFEKMNG